MNTIEINASNFKEIGEIIRAGCTPRPITKRFDGTAYAKDLKDATADIIADIRAKKAVQ